MADGDDREKKERVIHTRISENLEQELKSRAAALGVSVSNLVRNVLQNTSGLVEDIVSDSASLARSARGHGSMGMVVPAAGQAPAPARIIGWQRLVLNLNAVCAKCNDILPKGTEAAAAVADGPAPTTIICIACMEAIADDDRSEQPD